LTPKKYALDDEEIERVGKLGGPGVLEKLREEMEGLDMEGGEWEECVKSFLVWRVRC
jgi:periodic tryptophan protein 1